jgi:hypothetical protein
MAENVSANEAESLDCCSVAVQPNARFIKVAMGEALSARKERQVALSSLREALV